MAKTAADYRAKHRDKSTQLQVLAATADTTIITPKSADHQLFIQSITVGVTTYAAKVWIFQDSAGTPVPIWLISIPAAAGTTGADAQYRIDFGARGFGLTTGKNFDLNVDTAGAAAAITVEAYEVLVGPVASASTN